MNNIVILKWGKLKGYNFNKECRRKHRDIVAEFENLWEELYKNNVEEGVKNATDKEKEKIMNNLEKIYYLGIPFVNGWDDTYFNSFREIENYMWK